MPNVPGTFAGQQYHDLRLLMLPAMRTYYQERGEWGHIVGFRSYQYSQVVTLRPPGGSTVRQTWRLTGAHPHRHWTLTKETAVDDRDEQGTSP